MEGCDYTNVVAIDVGYHNFACCCVDNNSYLSPLYWRNENLWRKKAGQRTKPTKEDIIRITHAWCMRNKSMLDGADVIILESQMRTPFELMNAVIFTLYIDKVKVVHPMTVASFWRLPKTRVLKKPAGVEVVQALNVIIPHSHKLDDLADAWMMAVHELVIKGCVGRTKVLK